MTALPGTPGFPPNSPLYKGWRGTYVPAPMTLAAIDWLSISINLLLFVFVIVCLLMTLLILMQRPKQEGLGAAFGGGVTDQVFGARTTNVLQRGTVWLGSLFFILSLTLAVLVGQKNKQKSVKSDKPAVEEKAAETPKPAENPISLEAELEKPASGETDPTPPVEPPAPTEDPAPAGTPSTPPAPETPAETPSAPQENAGGSTENP